MKLILIRSVLVLAALTILWLLTGRRLTLLLDRLTLWHVPTPSVGTIHYGGGSLRIGDLDLTFGGADNLPYKLDLETDATNRVALVTAGKRFILGPRLNPVDRSGRPEIDLAADAGDEVKLTAGQSWIPWPTPFEYHFMSSSSPWWKRYVYYTLAWKKPSGERMEMRWRYQQDYDRGRWGQALMMWNWQTGLLRVNIEQ